MTFTGNKRTTTNRFPAKRDYKPSPRLVSWDDFLNERMRKEDSAVAAKFAAYVHLGRGHLRQDLCKFRWSFEDRVERS